MVSIAEVHVVVDFCFNRYCNFSPIQAVLNLIVHFMSSIVFARGNILLIKQSINLKIHSPIFQIYFFASFEEPSLQT